MSTPAKRRTSISPAATPLASTEIASSATSNPAETASSSSYFLPDLIPLVSSRLTCLQDFFALHAACRTYRAVLRPSPSNLASQAHLLIVPCKAPASVALFHAPLRLIICLRLPCRRSPRFTRIHGFGCRVAIYDGSIGAILRELSILHLVTGQRDRLPEPPKGSGGRVIFSGDLVLIFTQCHPVIHYCRIGDRRWREAWCDEGNLLYDLIFMKDTLYALICPNYRLAVVKLHNSSMELSLLGDESSAQPVHDSSQFLLAECGGELLLVVAVVGIPRIYQVFRWQSEERKWAKTTSLGGYSLFFNRLQFVGCLGGVDHPAVGRDCIYFTWYSRQWSEYSLVEGSWHEGVPDCLVGAAMQDYGPMAWVLPSVG